MRGITTTSSHVPILRGRQISGYLKKGIEIPMEQGRSTVIVSMIKWIRTSRLSIKNSLSPARAKEKIKRQRERTSGERERKMRGGATTSSHVPILRERKRRLRGRGRERARVSERER